MNWNKILIFAFIFTLFQACETDTKTPDQTPETVETLEQTPLQKLRAEAIPEDDIMGRILSGLATVQGEYDRSAPQMPDLGEVTVDTDDDCNLTIKNEVDGSVYETIVNMKDLATENGDFRLIPDHAPGDFPGFRVSTINDEPKVRLLKDGKEVNIDNQLVIYLADRPAVEKIIPAILQTIRICKGERPENR